MAGTGTYHTSGISGGVGAATDEVALPPAVYGGTASDEGTLSVKKFCLPGASATAALLLFATEGVGVTGSKLYTLSHIGLEGKITLGP